MRFKGNRLIFVGMLLILIGTLFALLVGCASFMAHTSESDNYISEGVSNINDDEIKAEEQTTEVYDSPNANNEQNSAATRQEIVTLLVYGGGGRERKK